MIRYIAVIDLGKTNSKLALVDAQTSRELHVISTPSSVTAAGIYPAIDHEAIEGFLTKSFRQLSAEYRIDAITVTTHGATAALIDAQGQLVLPVMDYECLHPDELSNEYAMKRSDFALTGSPRLPGGLNIGAQLYWQQATYPTQFAKARTLLTWPQYWVFRLTGKRWNDATSLGAHSDLYEPLKRCYSSLVDTMQWSHLMPPIHESGEYAGVVSVDMASQLGLSGQLPVYTGIHDSNASLVPYLDRTESAFTVVSTGTWFIAMAIGGSQVDLDESRDTLLNVNALGNPVPSARFMGGRERELLVTASAERAPDSLTTLLALKGAQTPLLMPSAVSGTGPYPHAKTHWLGTKMLSADVKDCAVALYLALMTQQCMQLIGSCGPTFIEGPLAHDEDFVRMLAAKSAREVYISDAQTGTSIGAAMLVKTPEEQPHVSPVLVDNTLRRQLANYGDLWENSLRDHLDRSVSN